MRQEESVVVSGVGAVAASASKISQTKMENLHHRPIKGINSLANEDNKSRGSEEGHC